MTWQTVCTLDFVAVFCLQTQILCHSHNLIFQLDLEGRRKKCYCFYKCVNAFRDIIKGCSYLACTNKPMLPFLSSEKMFSFLFSGSLKTNLVTIYFLFTFASPSSLRHFPLLLIPWASIKQSVSYFLWWFDLYIIKWCMIQIFVLSCFTSTYKLTFMSY